MVGRLRGGYRSFVPIRTLLGWNRALLAAIAALLAMAAALTAVSAAAASSSLPLKQGTAPEPGPPVLYEPLAQAPQLENAPGGVWRASPILVSGASAYRDGEYLSPNYGVV